MYRHMCIYTKQAFVFTLLEFYFHLVKDRSIRI